MKLEKPGHQSDTNAELYTELGLHAHLSSGSLRVLMKKSIGVGPAVYVAHFYPVHLIGVPKASCHDWLSMLI